MKSYSRPEYLRLNLFTELNMNWIESHIVQLVYFLDLISEILPVVLTVALIFTFFIVQSFSKKLSRMSFYLDRIDNHLREITYFIKDYRSGNPHAESKGSENADLKTAGLEQRKEDG